MSFHFPSNANFCGVVITCFVCPAIVLYKLLPQPQISPLFFIAKPFCAKNLLVVTVFQSVSVPILVGTLLLKVAFVPCTPLSANPIAHILPSVLIKKT